MSANPLLLPDFIIIGAMKSGTTTLYRYLAQHPGIDMSRDKETDFFVEEKNWGKGLTWYSDQFMPGNYKRGEASPNYSKCRDFPGVPARIAQICPDARLIYIVRDPVVRALSQFRHSFIMGTLDPDMSAFHGSHEYAHIMDASRYAEQLETYLAHFSRSAILVLDFDDLVRDPQAMMDLVTAHIGAAAYPVEKTGAQNDSAELSRIPAPLLRFAQSSAGRFVGNLLSRDLRDRIRGGLAMGKQRQSPAFSTDLTARMRDELAEDVRRFREISGLPFAHWSV